MKIFSALALMAVFSVSHAATESPERVTVYAADYFAGLNVLTAQDMVRRIPGSEAQLNQRRGNNRRGLRNKTESILIDGKKLVGKSSDADEYLQRLPASKVVRIEVIDGMVTETGSDAGSRTVNVITDGDFNSSGNWKASLRWVDELNTSTGAEMSYTRQFDSTELSLGLEYSPWDSLRQREEIEYISGTPVEQSNEMRERDAWQTELSATARISLSDSSTLAINASLELGPWDSYEFGNVFGFLGDGSGQLNESWQESRLQDNQSWEVGGTFEHQINDANLFQLLFLRNERDDDNDSRATFFDETGQVNWLSHEIREEHTEETVLRGTWFKSGSSGGNFDMGLELAINTLDQQTTLVEGESVPLTEVSIPNADQVISEDRAELFANYSFSVKRMRVRLGLAAEYSELDQQGPDVSLNRSLDYIKPSVTLSYDNDKSGRFFLTLKRDVGQLHFGDFVTYIDPWDNEIRAGNPNLEPETSWDLEVGSEHLFAEDTGLFKLRLFHRWVDEVTELVPLGEDDSQPGNVPEGRQWGIETNFGLRMEGIGLPGAVLNGFYKWQDSEVQDPFTGETREFEGNERYEAGVDFRHDLEKTPFAYGFTWSREGRELRFDVDRNDTSTRDDNLHLFIERRLANAMILRLTARGINEPEWRRSRQNYTPDRAGGTVSSTETHTDSGRRSVTLSLSGAF